nr:MAG TPA: hypothetical protein [Bacteriophage sp.]
MVILLIRQKMVSHLSYFQTYCSIIMETELLL